jgi:hypothetical protein
VLNSKQVDKQKVIRDFFGGLLHENDNSNEVNNTLPFSVI